MHRTIISILMPLLLLANTDNYFQQEVKYSIDVELDDSTHTLTAFESIVYQNNSPDTLDVLWFHLWPNAYKNTETAFAKQAFKNGSTWFYFSNDETRGYIDSLNFTIDGVSVDWTFHDEWIDVAKIILPKPLLPEESITIETPFFVKLPNVYSRLGHSGKHYEITQWFPKPAVYDKDGWHPMPYLNMGEFYSEFGTFDVKITLPQDYRIMATGDLINGETEYAWLDSLAEEGEKLSKLSGKTFKNKIKELESDPSSKFKLFNRNKSEKTPFSSEMKTLHFHQENVHDFAWFADPNWIVRKGELYLADSTKSVTLWSMYLPKNAELWNKSIEYIHDAGYWYSQFYGDYPYNHITAVDGDMSAGGGMEYPNITVISSGMSVDLLEFVIMHEVGHNWFYGILGNDERVDPWMDEGLNEYANIKYWEKKYPERNGQVVISDFAQNKIGIGKNLDFRWALAYMGYVNRSTAGDDQPITLESEQYHQGNYGSIIYGKSSIVFRFLEHYLGEEKMDTIMQEFYETWKFKHPEPYDFQHIVESNVEEDLSWFFDDLLNSTNIIDYSLKQKGKQIILTNEGSITCPVEIVFFNKFGKEVKREWYKNIKEKTTVTMPSEAVKAIIDPDNIMPDIRRVNHSTKRPINFHFVFDQPDYHKKEWYWVPWLIGNRYNGITPGFVLYSGFIPTYDYGIGLNPMWDFKHQKLIGSLSSKKTWYQKFGFRSMTLSGKFSEYGYYTGKNVSFSGTIKKPIVSTPTFMLNASVFNQQLTGDALNPDYYTSGDFTTIILDATYIYKPNPLLNYEISVGTFSGAGDSDFTKFYFKTIVNSRWTKAIKSQIRLWMGGFIYEKDIPNQYLTYLGGGVDPHFEDILVLDRSADATSYLNILDEQYVEDGPSMKGRVIENGVAVSSDKLSWAVNLNQSIPKIPFNFFADFAGASDLSKKYLDAGVKFGMGNVNLYIPLFQNWDGNQTPSDFGWIKDRLRVEITLPNIKF